MERNKQGHIIVDSQETPETRDGVAIVFNQETLDDAINKIENGEITTFELIKSSNNNLKLSNILLLSSKVLDSNEATNSIKTTHGEDHCTFEAI